MNEKKLMNQLSSITEAQRKVLDELWAKTHQESINIYTTLLIACAGAYGVNEGDILNKETNEDVCMARGMYFYCMNRFLRINPTTIGEWTDYDRSNVYTSIKMYEQQLNQNQVAKKKIYELKNLIDKNFCHDNQ